MEMHVGSRQASFIYVLLVVFFFSGLKLSAQAGNFAAPFLLFSPSASQSGMGETGTSIPLTDDPYNFYFNPAQLGFSSMNNNFMAGFNPFSDTRVNISPVLGIEGLKYNTYAFQAGYNFKNLPGGIPLSIGAGFFRQYIDLCEFISTTTRATNCPSHQAYGLIIGKWG